MTEKTLNKAMEIKSKLDELRTRMKNLQEMKNALEPNGLGIENEKVISFGKMYITVDTAIAALDMDIKRIRECEENYLNELSKLH